MNAARPSDLLRACVTTLGLALVLAATSSTLAAEKSVLKVLHDFNRVDGASSEGTFVQGRNSKLYAVVRSGGQELAGTFIRVTAGGHLTLLHSFDRDVGGWEPTSLILGADGDFYGTTYGGGPNGSGTLFRITPHGKLTVLHGLAADGSECAAPNGLVQAGDGAFYGTALGGVQGLGCVFKFAQEDGVFTVLHSFNGDDGAFPVQNLIQASDGDFYGTTRGGGDLNAGTAFRMRADGKLTVLHHFDPATGAIPVTGLVEDAHGRFYGATDTGSSPDNQFGTLFRLNRHGDMTVLHGFAYETGGVYPRGRLLIARDGNLYGTTMGGGKHAGGEGKDWGTAFRMTPTGRFTRLHTFSDEAPEGAAPMGGLTELADGEFYGMTSYAGAHWYGSIYRIRINP